MQPQDNAPVPRQSQRRHRLNTIFVWCALAVAAVILVTAPAFLRGARQEALVRIPATATPADVTDTLTKYFGHSYARLTTALMGISREHPHTRHGAWLVNKGLSPVRTALLLTRGAQHPVKVTVNGQRTLRQAAEATASRLDFSADSLIAAATDPQFLAKHGLTPRQALALWIDDTYEVYWSASPSQLLDKIGANYDRLWDQQRRNKARSLGLAPADVMALCSIVDEETLNDDEKGKIGRLYLNRLAKGMRLQADPTVRYAVGDFSIRRVQGVHLKKESPYNTYLYAGLPPGPIRTGRARTVDLVLFSQPSDDLYMCARYDFSGRHDFAATYAEHQANARRYQKALDERGIK